MYYFIRVGTFNIRHEEKGFDWSIVRYSLKIKSLKHDNQYIRTTHNQYMPHNIHINIKNCKGFVRVKKLFYLIPEEGKMVNNE